MIVHIIFVLNILIRFTGKLLRNVSRPACHGKIPWKARQYFSTHFKNFSNLHIDPLRGLPLVLAVLADCSPTCSLTALAIIVCVNSWNQTKWDLRHPLSRLYVSAILCMNTFSYFTSSLRHAFSSFQVFNKESRFNKSIQGASAGSPGSHSVCVCMCLSVCDNFSLCRSGKYFVLFGLNWSWPLYLAADPRTGSPACQCWGWGWWWPSCLLLAGLCQCCPPPPPDWVTPLPGADTWASRSG